MGELALAEKPSAWTLLGPLAELVVESSVELDDGEPILGESMGKAIRV